MASIFDYLKWRGDITFDTLPCNEVDALLFSMISYNKFEELFAWDGSDDGLIFQCAGDMYFADRKKDVPLGALIPASPMRAFRNMYRIPRYRDVMIGNFVNRINERDGYQFCAMTLGLGDSVTAVIFRGTDDTVVGWNEDFRMPTVDAIPGEILAAEYLQEIAAKTTGRLIVIGHSKGGIEALYAAVKAPKKIQDRIDVVYSFDGPGANDALINSAGYRRMTDRYVHIIPQTSFVGLLFGNPETPVIAKSVRIGGAAQHDALSWEVMGGKLIYSEKLTPRTAEQMGRVNRLIGSMSAEEIQKFVDIFFTAINKTGAKTLTEFGKRIIPNIGTFISSVNTNERAVKAQIMRIINQFVSIALNTKETKAIRS